MKNGWYEYPKEKPDVKTNTLFLCVIDAPNKRFVDARTYWACSQEFTNGYITYWRPLPELPDGRDAEL